MVERGRGAIVTMASTAARLASGDRIGAPTGYAVAKAGVVRLTREVAKEVAGQGVRVNCVSPATILTERLQAMIPADRRERLTAMPPGRAGDARGRGPRRPVPVRPLRLLDYRGHP